MSSIQQPSEQKGPTIWNVLGVGVLIGVLIGAFVYGSYNGMLNWRVVLIPIIPAIIGAGIGVSLPKSISNKRRGLWIGAIFGPILIICLLFGGGIT